MKKVLLFLPALALSFSAFATNEHPKPKPAPKHKPVVVKPVSDASAKSVSGSKSVSDSESVSKAVSGSESASSVGDISADSSGGSVNDNSEFNSRAWSLVLPPPVFTPPMPRPEVPQGCPAPTETQDALQIGGPIYSSAKSLRDNSPCVAIRYSQILWDRCQYQKSDRILAMGMKKFAREVGEEWDAQADPNIPNYTLEECGILKKTMALTAAAAATPPVLLIPPKEPSKTLAPCAKGQKRNSKGVCYTPKPPCEDGKVLACVKKS